MRLNWRLRNVLTYLLAYLLTYLHHRAGVVIAAVTRAIRRDPQLPKLSPAMDRADIDNRRSPSHGLEVIDSCSHAPLPGVITDAVASTTWSKPRLLSSLTSAYWASVTLNRDNLQNVPGLNRTFVLVHLCQNLVSRSQIKKNKSFNARLNICTLVLTH